jgi:hypothetical protein
MNGGPIHWYFRHRTIVALSTCEAEYIAASTTTEDAAWIGPHVRELVEMKTGEEKPATVPIRVDNQGAIALARRDGWNRRTRHMNVHYQYVQKALRDGSIRMKYVAPGEQLPGKPPQPIHHGR